MTQLEILKLLKLLSSVWTNLAVTDDIVDSWYFIFCDEKPLEVLAATRYLIKTAEKNSFCPRPHEILAAMRELKFPLETVERVWAVGPQSASSETAKNVWKLWGGVERWKLLPDEKFADNSGFARRDICMARKEFCEIWNSVVSEKCSAPLHVQHSDAVQCLANLKQVGLNFSKLLT